MKEFSELQAFVEVAALGSLTRAAEKLGISKSIVSRRLAKLEADLGTQLLARSTRSIALTDKGRDFFERARRILTEVDEVRIALADQDGELAGHLRLAAPRSIVEFLGPVIAEFSRLHPLLWIDTSYVDHRTDLISGGFDAAIRIGNPGSGSMIAQKITDVPIFIVAAPSYLSSRLPPAVPQDLVDHDVLLYSGHGDASLWQFGPGIGGVRVQGRFRSDSGDALRDAAIAGLGIGMFPEFLVHRHIRSGALIPLLVDLPQNVIPMNLVRPAGPSNARLRALFALLSARMGQGRAWRASLPEDGDGLAQIA